MEYWFIDKQVQKRGVVGLDHKEEYLFQRYVKELWSYDDVGRVGPYSIRQG